MAKPRKKKSGLHKHVSSVLRGVPIPQGVCNWWPPGKGPSDRRSGSSEVPQPGVSSLFKDVPEPGRNSVQPPLERSPEYSRTETSPTEMPTDQQTSQLNPTEQRQPPEERPADVGDKAEQAPEGRLVCYHDPAEEVCRLSLRQRIWKKFFGAKN
jgi:hypothetical protein